MKVTQGGDGMLRSKRLILILVVVATLLAAFSLASAQTVEYRSLLSGTVVNVVSVGDTVKEGTVLVEVNRIGATVAVARATAEGVVKEVLVKQGDTIAKDAVVVRIETSRK